MCAWLRVGGVRLCEGRVRVRGSGWLWGDYLRRRGNCVGGEGTKTIVYVLMRRINSHILITVTPSLKVNVTRVDKSKWRTDNNVMRIGSAA